MEGEGFCPAALSEAPGVDSDIAKGFNGCRGSRPITSLQGAFFWHALDLKTKLWAVSSAG